MKRAFAFIILLGLSVSAQAGSRIETREHVLSEKVVSVSQCHTQAQYIRPLIWKYFAYVAKKQQVELYKVQVISTSWWSGKTEQFIKGSNQVVERNQIEEKIFSSDEECQFWATQQPHSNRIN